MKTYRIACIVLIGLLAAAFTYADDGITRTRDPNLWSTYSYRNVTIERIYPHRLGYVVAYRKGMSDIAYAYLPLDWFTQAAGKGEIVRLSSGSTWPHLSIFYNDGVFSHVRLYIVPNYNHDSWGRLPSGINIDAEFEIEEIRLEY